MPATLHLGDVTHVIQLAIAPVFLLTAIGTRLNVLVNRLGRSVDRRRTLTASLPTLDATLASNAQGELAYVHRRVRLIYIAIITIDLSQLVAILFMLAMLALIGSLALFLREIYLGVNTVACPIP